MNKESIAKTHLLLPYLNKESSSHRAASLLTLFRLTDKERYEILNKHGWRLECDVEEKLIRLGVFIKSSTNVDATEVNEWVLTNLGFELKRLIERSGRLGIESKQMSNNEACDLLVGIREHLTGWDNRFSMFLDNVNTPANAWGPEELDKHYEWIAKYEKTSLVDYDSTHYELPDEHVGRCRACGRKGKFLESGGSTARHNEGSVHYRVVCESTECEKAKTKIWDMFPHEAINRFNGFK